MPVYQPALSGEVTVAVTKKSSYTTVLGFLANTRSDDMVAEGDVVEIYGILTDQPAGAGTPLPNKPIDVLLNLIYQTTIYTAVDGTFFYTIASYPLGSHNWEFNFPGDAEYYDSIGAYSIIGEARTPSLTIGADRASIAPGESVTLSGNLIDVIAMPQYPIPGKGVEIQRKYGTVPYETIAIMATDVNGLYSYADTPPYAGYTYTYRAYFPGGSYEPVTSGEVGVQVTEAPLPVPWDLAFLAFIPLAVVLGTVSYNEVQKVAYQHR